MDEELHLPLTFMMSSSSSRRSSNGSLGLGDLTELWNEDEIPNSQKPDGDDDISSNSSSQSNISSSSSIIIGNNASGPTAKPVTEEVIVTQRTHHVAVPQSFSALLTTGVAETMVATTMVAAQPYDAAASLAQSTTEMETQLELREQSMNTPPLVTTEADNNVLRLFMVLRRTGPVATAMAHIYIKLTKVGPEGVKVYCINTLGYSNSRYNSTFNATERNIFEDSWDPLQLDVTLLYKLLQNVCGLAALGNAIWTTPADTIEYMLYNAKAERNTLAHEVVSLTKQHVRKTLAKLIVIFSTAFDKVSERTGETVDNEKDAFIKSLENILIASISTKTFKICQQDLNKAKEEKLSRIIVLARKDLYCLHDKLKYISPITWGIHTPQNTLMIDKIFTDLDMKMKDIAVKLEELFSLSQVVIVQGLNGSGKSVIVRKLFHSWCTNNHQIDRLDECDIIVPIQCPYIRSKDLATYLKEELLYHALLDVQNEEVISVLQDARLIFIIDAWDEAAASAKEIVFEAFAKFSGARFLITSRPEFSKDLHRDINVYSHGLRVSDINVLGFNEEKQSEYIKKMFLCMSESITLSEKESKKSLDKFIAFLENKRSLLGKMVKLPLILSFLIILWLDNSLEVRKLSTTTQVYRLLLKMTQHKMVERIRSRDGEKRNTEELMRKSNKWILYLAKEAWEALKKNQTYLSDTRSESLMEECQRLDINPMDAMSSLLQSETGGTIFNSVLVWSFYHRTMQEYLAALHLCKMVNESGENIPQLFENEESHQSTDVAEDRSYIILMYNLFVRVVCHKNSERDIIQPHSSESAEINSVNVIVFLSALLSQEGNMNSLQAKNILKVLKDFALNRNVIAKLIKECEENNFITDCVKSKRFHIKQFDSKAVTNILIISKYTICTFEKNLRIIVDEVTNELIDLIATLLRSYNIIPNMIFSSEMVKKKSKKLLSKKLSGFSRHDYDDSALSSEPILSSEQIYNLIGNNETSSESSFSDDGASSSSFDDDYEPDVIKKSPVLQSKKIDLDNAKINKPQLPSRQPSQTPQLSQLSPSSSTSSTPSLRSMNKRFQSSIYQKPKVTVCVGDFNLPPALAQELECDLNKGKFLFLDENQYDKEVGDDESSDSDWDY